MNDNSYISLAHTKELAAKLDEYRERTGSSIENITTVAKVDKGLPTRMKRGGCCTVAQRDKLEYLFARHPDGVRMNDSVAYKVKGAEEIEARRDEAALARIAHFERCRSDHARRYGQDTSDWTPVERMLA